MDQTDITTPNPCILTIEEQNQFLAFLRKFNIKLGVIHLPTAPAGNPFGAIGLGPNLQIKASKLDTIQDIQIISSPLFFKLNINDPTNLGNTPHINLNGCVIYSPAGTGQLTIGSFNTPRAVLDLVKGSSNTGTAAKVLMVQGLDNVALNFNNGQPTVQIDGVYNISNSFLKDIGGSIGLGGKWTSIHNGSVLFAGIKGAKENITDTNYSGYYAIYTNLNGVGLTEWFRVSSLGYIGINTTTPTKRFSISEKLQIDDNGLPIKSNNIPLVGQGNVLVVGIGGTTSSGAIANITSFVVGGTTSFFEIGGYINVTAFTAGTISMFCTYTDPSGNAQTLTVPLVSLAGAPVTTVGSLTDAQALVTSIVALNGTTITIGTTVVAFTGTYNAYAWIKQIA